MYQSTHTRGTKLRITPRRVQLTRFVAKYRSSSYPRRVRPIVGAISVYIRMFQSTHTRRVRLLYYIQEHPILGFNPRTHVGCDLQELQRQQRFSGRFNPRTHVGCDSMAMTNQSKFASFNPRTHVGCDLIAPFKEALICMFQSTHPRRVRQGIRQLLAEFFWFQSTHPHRVRPSKRAALQALECFNPRTHIGCDSRCVASKEMVASFNPRTHIGCD